MLWGEYNAFTYSMRSKCSRPNLRERRGETSFTCSSDGCREACDCRSLTFGVILNLSDFVSSLKQKTSFGKSSKMRPFKTSLECLESSQHSWVSSKMNSFDLFGLEKHVADAALEEAVPSWLPVCSHKLWHLLRARSWPVEDSIRSGRPGGCCFVPVDVCSVSHWKAKALRAFDVVVLSGVTSCSRPQGRRGIPIQLFYFPGEHSHNQLTGQLSAVSLPSLETLLLCQE